jgi:midasin (ATPase involved in ribosome maturation)
MKGGKLLLLDEISLAQDSVLERLNPLLEIDRKLLLTDSGAQTELIESKTGFQFVATMNPGGDHGKKEVGLNIWVIIQVFSCQKRFEIVSRKFGAILSTTTRMFSQSCNVAFICHLKDQLTKKKLRHWHNSSLSILAILINAMRNFSSSYKFN